MGETNGLISILELAELKSFYKDNQSERSFTIEDKIKTVNETQQLLRILLNMIFI